MTTTTTGRANRWRQFAAPGTMLIGGGALAGATAASGASVALTAVEAALTVAFSVAFWIIGRTRGDFGAVFGSRPDERQHAIDLRATAAAGISVCLLCIVMSVIEVARGTGGTPWVTLCAVFGGVYVIALAIFRR